jgi:hypothetical protein
MLTKAEMLWPALATLKFRPFILGASAFGKKVGKRKSQPGEPLDALNRADMEELLGCDFRDVRIYDDRQAGELARQLNAEAFTVGNRVFAAPGKLNTATLAGKALLAHELTHVVQQTERHVTSWPALERSLPCWQTTRSNADHLVPQLAASSRTGGSGGVVQRAREAEAQAVEHSVRETSGTGSLRAERGNVPAAEIDAEDIADRVYRLMQSELVLERERARAQGGSVG